MKDSQNNKLSIITIVLNGSAHIEETILSVITQTDVKIEYIIIDGGSTDDTLQKINKYENYVSHLISETDGGIYQAINKGIKLASYPLVGLIHCGDVYTPGALSAAYEAFNKTGADVVYGNVQIREEINGKYLIKTLTADHSLLMDEMSIYHPSTFIKLDIYKKLGVYNVTYRSAADYDLLLSLFLQNCHFTYVPQALAIFTSGGLSGNNIKLSLQENYRIRKNRIGIAKALSYIVSVSLINGLYRFRRYFISLIVGKNNFNKLKSYWRTSYVEEIKKQHLS
jgi:glycosyltransferase involved in cell wall biosynthesis